MNICVRFEKTKNKSNMVPVNYGSTKLIFFHQSKVHVSTNSNMATCQLSYVPLKNKLLRELFFPIKTIFLQDIQKSLPELNNLQQEFIFRKDKNNTPIGFYDPIGNLNFLYQNYLSELKSSMKCFYPIRNIVLELLLENPTGFAKYPSGKSTTGIIFPEVNNF